MSRKISVTNTTTFSGSIDNRTLSAHPQFTGISETSLLCGFSGTRPFEGYNFKSITYIMISANNNQNVFTTNHILSSYDHYSVVSAQNTDLLPSSTLSAHYPEVSGFLITSYRITSDNTLEIDFPTVSATGTIDIIAINPAGIGRFTQDLQDEFEIMSPATYIPVIDHYYIESPDTKYYWPLYNNEADARYVAANIETIFPDSSATNSSNVSTVTHVFQDEPSQTTWYMPANARFELISESPLDEPYTSNGWNPSSITWRQIRTSDDSLFAPTYLSLSSQSYYSYENLNLQIAPVPANFTTTVSGLPTGIIYDSESGILSGSLTGVSSTQTYPVSVYRSNNFGTTESIVDISVTVLDHKYIESPDDTFIWPLYNSELDAIRVDENIESIFPNTVLSNTSPGSAVSLTFIDEPTDTTWYAPANVYFSGASAAPINGTYPSEGWNPSYISWIEIATEADSLHVPPTFSSSDYTFSTSIDVNIQISPISATYTTVVTGLPSGLVYDTNLEAITGTTPNLSADTTYTIGVTRTNDYGSSFGTFDITINSINHYYIEASTGSFYWPLYDNTNDANFVASNIETVFADTTATNLETPSTTSFVFESDPTSATWYMPDNARFIDVSAAPISGTYPSEGWSPDNVEWSSISTVSAPVTSEFYITTVSEIADWSLVGVGHGEGVPDVPPERIIDATQPPYNIQIGLSAADQTAAFLTAAEAIGDLRDESDPRNTIYVMYLPAGEYNVPGEIIPDRCIIRGAGKDQTILYNNLVDIDRGLGSETDTLILDSTISVGQTSITLSTTPPASGLFMRITEDDDGTIIDPYGIEDVSGWNPYGDPVPRNRAQLVEVVDSTDNGDGTYTVEFYPPLIKSFSASQNPRAIWFSVINRYAGIEDLTLTPASGSSPSIGIRVYRASHWWVKGVRINNRATYAIDIRESQCGMVSGCDLEDATNATPGGGYGIGFLLNPTQVLIIDNYSAGIRTPIVISGGTFNVIVDNYLGWMINYQTNIQIRCLSFHACYPEYFLVENNIGHGPMASDNIHGNNANNLIFRNNFTGQTTDPRTMLEVGKRNIAIDLQQKARNYEIIGNVLGWDGMENENGQTSYFEVTGRTRDDFENYGIMMGYASDGDSSPAGNDTDVEATTIRHANYWHADDTTYYLDGANTDLKTSFYYASGSEPAHFPLTDYTTGEIVTNPAYQRFIDRGGPFHLNNSLSPKLNLVHHYTYRDREFYDSVFVESLSTLYSAIRFRDVDVHHVDESGQITRTGNINVLLDAFVMHYFDGIVWSGAVTLGEITTIVPAVCGGSVGQNSTVGGTAFYNFDDNGSFLLAFGSEGIYSLEHLGSGAFTVVDQITGLNATGGGAVSGSDIYYGDLTTNHLRHASIDVSGNLADTGVILSSVDTGKGFCINGNYLYVGRESNSSINQFEINGASAAYIANYDTTGLVNFIRYNNNHLFCACDDNEFNIFEIDNTSLTFSVSTDGINTLESITPYGTGGKFFVSMRTTGIGHYDFLPLSAGVVSSEPVSAPLDDLDNIWSARSLRLLRSDYSGPVVQAMRDSDNTLSTFGVDELSSAELSTWGGAGNIHIQTHYDQGPNGYNWTQTTSSNQPIIYESGVMLENNNRYSLKFNSTTDRLQNSQTSSLPASASVIVAVKWAELHGSFDRFILYSDTTSTSRTLGFGLNGDPASWYSNAGTPSLRINGVDQGSITTRNAFFDAIIAETTCVIRFDNVDFSGWSNINFGSSLASRPPIPWLVEEAILTNSTDADVVESAMISYLGL